MMSMWTVAELKAHAMRFFEAFNAGDLDALENEIVGEEYIQHSPGVPPQRQALMRYLKQTMTSFPNGRFEINHMIAEGDKVLTHWTFIGNHTGPSKRGPATGKEVRISGMDLWRINGAGKIGEAWFYMDMSAFSQRPDQVPAGQEQGSP